MQPSRSARRGRAALSVEVGNALGDRRVPIGAALRAQLLVERAGSPRVRAFTGSRDCTLLSAVPDGAGGLRLDAPPPGWRDATAAGLASFSGAAGGLPAAPASPRVVVLPAERRSPSATPPLSPGRRARARGSRRPAAPARSWRTAASSSSTGAAAAGGGGASRSRAASGTGADVAAAGRGRAPQRGAACAPPEPPFGALASSARAASASPRRQRSLHHQHTGAGGRSRSLGRLQSRAAGVGDDAGADAAPAPAASPRGRGPLGAHGRVTQEALGTLWRAAEPAGPLELDAAAPRLRGAKLSAPAQADVDYVLSRWSRRCGARARGARARRPRRRPSADGSLLQQALPRASSSLPPPAPQRGAAVPGGDGAAGSKNRLQRVQDALGFGRSRGDEGEEGARPRHRRGGSDVELSAPPGLASASTSSSGSAAQPAAPPIAVPRGGGVADDATSVATQAGSAAHSFSSLHSMFTDAGDGCSDAGGAPPFAGGAAAPPFRGSDAGGDGAASVSTLPLISEAYGEDEVLLEALDEAHGPASLASPRRAAALAAADGDGDDAGSLAASDASAPLPPQPPAAWASAPVAVRVPGRGARGSGSGGGRLGAGGAAPGGEAREGAAPGGEAREGEPVSAALSGGLPLPFSTRRRPDNDDTCSYATQAGSSMTSMSSLLSSAAPSLHGGAHAAGGAGQAAHPLSQPACSELGEPGGGRPSEEGAGRAQSLSSCGEQPGKRKCAGLAASPGGPAGASPAALGGPAGASPAPGGEGSLERRGSLKGALRSVMAWGSGLGQRLHAHGGKQQHSAAAAASHGSSGGGGRHARQSSSSSQELVRF
ncbi:hypothetical protein HT031_002465 [Scenedesmus sp. PABB004]|nr:hypothetical protein HT031_002465 [Scenedesmus sp. PABB004]